VWDEIKQCIDVSKTSNFQSSIKKHLLVETWSDCLQIACTLHLGQEKYSKNVVEKKTHTRVPTIRMGCQVELATKIYEYDEEDM
jgi:hypothetical protein